MKSVILMLVLAVMSAPAFASKARLNSLGQDGYNGSFFINDNRNIFLNAANVNNFKNLASLELGGDSKTGGAQGEGTVLFGAGNLVYGVNLGHEATIAQSRKLLGFTYGGPLTPAVSSSDILDIFVGGDAGVKWGASASVGFAKNSVGNKENTVATRFGVIAGDLEVFTSLSIYNKIEDAAGNDLFKGKFGGQVGATYKLNDFKVYGAVKRLDGTIAGTTKRDATVYLVGAGYTKGLNDKATIYANADFNMGNADVLGKGTYWYVPLTVGLEYNAKAWLTLRGFATQTFHVEDLKTAQKGDSTNVGAGASLKFDTFTVDTSLAAGANPASQGTGASVGFTSDVFGTVSATYRW